MVYKGVFKNYKVVDQVIGEGHLFSLSQGLFGLCPHYGSTRLEFAILNSCDASDHAMGIVLGQ